MFSPTTSSGLKRMPTGQKQQANMESIGLKTEMKVPATPLNREGMKGVASSAGPGRQVSDITYYHNQLIKRNKEISDEIYKMRQKIDQLQKDSEQYNIYEKQCEELTKEINKLEGTLADYNLSSDKYRNHVAPQDVMMYYQQIKAKNQRDRQEIDNIFSERRRVDDEIIRVENEIETISNEMTTQLQSLDPNSQKKYQLLQIERQKLMELGQQKHRELEELGKQIFELERYIKSDQNLKQYNEYETELKKLLKERKSIQWEFELLELNEEDGKKYLIEKAKLLKSEIADVDDNLESLRESNDNFRKLLREMNQESENNKDEENQKLELLRNREKDMNEFINNYPQLKETEINEQNHIKETIVGLLQHISENTNQMTLLPDQGQYKTMEKELRFKEQQKESAEQTKGWLQDQLSFQQKDLDKIMTIDVRLNNEIKQLMVKMEQLKGEILIFEDMDNVKKQYDMNKNKLQKILIIMKYRFDHLKNQTEMAAKEYTRIKSDVTSRKEYIELQNQLKKLRDHEMSVFTLNENIESSSRSIDYQSTKDECMRLVDIINKETINIHLNS